MQVGDVIDRRFRVIERAGAGGMGVVFRAEDIDAGRQVALKALRHVDRSHAQRFDREAALLAALRHPSIVGYIAHGRDESGDHYLAMEWIDGRTLTHQLDADGLTLAESATVVGAVAAALGHAHAAGVVHRDIKPSNILFEGSDLSRVKVIDFGIARREDDAFRFTESGTVLGTPSYMAPEQARSARGVDARADVFALGCVLYECLTGQVAFGGTNPLAVRAKAIAMNPARPRTLNAAIPAELDELVWAMLAKDPAARFADGAAAARALAGVSVAPGGERVQRAVDDTQTAVLIGGSESAADPASLVCVLLAAVPEDMARLRAATAGELEATRARLGALAGRFGGRCETLQGQVYLLVLDAGATPHASARAAASCALAVRDAFPAMALVLTSSSRSAAGDAVDRCARTMEVTVRGALLAPDAGGGEIRIDAFAAGLLAAEFAVEQVGSKTFYLRGRKRA